MCSTTPWVASSERARFQSTSCPCVLAVLPTSQPIPPPPLYTDPIKAPPPTSSNYIAIGTAPAKALSDHCCQTFLQRPEPNQGAEG